MKLKIFFSASLLCALSACAFFETPLDIPGSASAPASSAENLPAAPAATTANLPPPPPPLPPTLPSPSQNKAEASSALTSTEGTFLIVSTIFEVPETVPNLSFVHFTDSNRRRETAICEALLDIHPITSPAAVPATARNLIIWPIEEGKSANNCRAMVRAHEPLDISSQTAQVVNSAGPYLMSRNSPQQKQMIYDLTSVATGDIAGALAKWKQTLTGDVQRWPPLIRAN